MFDFFKKNKECSIKSPMNGEAISLSDVPDEAFSDKMLGDGAAVIPSDGEVRAPVDGVVVQIPDTLHAYGIQSKDGLDILIHIGINTVELKGEGFESLVKVGQEVKTGQLIAKFDIEFIKERGYPLHTPVLITNVDAIKEMSFSSGKVEGGKTELIKYKK